MKTKHIISWTLRITIAVIFIQTLYFKFTAHPDSVYIFTKLGAEPFGRIGLGVVELITSILILQPRTKLIGIIISFGVIFGAIFSHFLVIGTNVKGDSGTLFTLALVVFTFCLILFFIYKNEMRELILKNLKKMKINIINLILFVLIFNSNLYSQVIKTNIVEHFTNTSCGVCAVHNNTIQNSINANPSTLHISFHPSSPYTSDFFSLQNKMENDARTNFYGIFGSTPRTVLNGVPTAYNTLATVLPTLQNITSNFQITVTQSQVSAGNYNSITTITKVANDTTINAILFVGVYENPINQATNNGETVHYNVFRKALTAPEGITITLPSAIGESITFTYPFQSGASWQTGNLKTMGILQNVNKNVINSSSSANNLSENNFNLAFENANLIFPNPSNGIVTLKKDVKNAMIYDIQGRKIESFENLFANQTINLTKYKKGIYIFANQTNDIKQLQKIIIQ